MMRGLHHALLVLFVTAVPVFAQNSQSVPRAILLPDTMGANFAAADTLTGTSGPTDYDFLVGTWRFTFQARRRDGSFTPAFNGHWVFTKKQTGGQGVLIEEAGGLCTNWRGAPTQLEDREIVAGPPALQRTLVERLLNLGEAGAS